MGSGASSREGGGSKEKKKHAVLAIIDVTYVYQPTMPSRAQRSTAIDRECFWWFPVLHQTPAWVQTAESGPAHSWYLYYLENRKSMRITSIFFHFSHAFIHSCLTLFLRHFLSTEGQGTDYLGVTYLVSALSDSEKRKQDKYMHDTWEGHKSQCASS